MAMRTGSQDAAYSDHNVTAIRIIRHTKTIICHPSEVMESEGYRFGLSVSGAWRKYIILCRFYLPIFWRCEHIPKQSWTHNAAC